MLLEEGFYNTVANKYDLVSYLFIYLFIYLLNYLSIYQFIYLFIQSLNRNIYLAKAIPIKGFVSHLPSLERLSRSVGRIKKNSKNNFKVIQFL